MPSKRDVLAQLSREELLSVVERFELEAADRRKKDNLLEAGSSSRKALAAFMPELSCKRGGPWATNPMGLSKFVAMMRLT